MIRVLIVDDHLAVRAGLERLLRAEPGFVIAGVALGTHDAMSQAQRGRPDVAVVDHQLPDGDGLTLCRGLKQLPQPARVLVYSAFADRDLTIPALLAGADGLLDKGASANELFRTLRLLWRGERAIPAPSADQIAATGGKLPLEDLPILGMIVDRTPPAEIAAVLRMQQSRLETRLDTMIQRLTADHIGGFMGCATTDRYMVGRIAAPKPSCNVGTEA